jgi:hypothetical protein
MSIQTLNLRISLSLQNRNLYPTPGTIKRKAAATFAELSEKDTRNRKNSVRNIGESSNSTRRKQTLCMKSAKTSKDL